MQVTDTIADLLTRIRNAIAAKHDVVEIPASKTKRDRVRILCEEGYIKRYLFTDDDKQGMIKVFLKYTEDRKPVIMGLKRVSKPGLRIYTDVENMPKVMQGLGVALISTSKGIMTDRKARKNNVGGEVMAFVW